MDDRFEIFLVCAPGLEPILLQEATRLGFPTPVKSTGGVSFHGTWRDVARANLELRTATRVLARFATFRAMHPAQLDKRARKLDWAALLRPDVPVRVDATCRKSRIYHAGAARSRIEGAITATIGALIKQDANIVIKARIEDDLCTLSVDTSGESLHKRGHKTWTGKAPLRETLAAAALFACGYDGSQTVIDPMCGSGTFLIEAAEIAAGLAPGRARNFALNHLAVNAPRPAEPGPIPPEQIFFGYDRDTGAIQGASQNAERAGVATYCNFAHQPLGALTRPSGLPGLIMVNPPYGARIGNRKALFGLYASLGTVFRAHFSGWHLGMITSDGGLAKATGLSLSASDPIDFNGTKVKLYQTDL